MKRERIVAEGKCERGDEDRQTSGLQGEFWAKCSDIIEYEKSQFVC